MSDKIKVNYMVLSESVIINYIDNSGHPRTFTIRNTEDDYELVMHHINAKTTHMIPAILDPQESVREFCKSGEFTIHKGVAYADGEPVPGYIGEKLVEFAEKNLPFTPLLNFWRKLKRNPSENSKAQLYRFLEVCQVPLTEDGNFIAYKSVRSNMTDHHSGKVQYALGKPTNMKRSEVEDRPTTGCGRGLHVGAYSYAMNQYSGINGRIILEVEVDPYNVVSVPNDCSFKKLRACEVTPIAICHGEYKAAVVITKEEHEEETEFYDTESIDVPAEVLPVEGEVSGMIVIGRNTYVVSEVSESYYTALANCALSEFTEITQIRPSKAAKSIKGMGEVHSCVRAIYKESPEIPVYIAEYDSKYVMCVPEGLVIITDVPVSSVFVSDSEFMKSITVAQKTLNALRRSEATFSGHWTSIRSLGRSKYPVALKKIDEFGTKIKSMKRAFDEISNDVAYLVILSNGTIIQYS